MLILSMAVTYGAFLLFLVQPLMAAFILPWFGGAPAVWTTAMLFFQTVLLAGYAYAHGIARWTLRRQTIAHAALVFLSMLALPIAPDLAAKPTDATAPILHILGLLTVCVGLPYLVLSSTSTLMQAWIARLSGQSPYRVYAWSNAASMAALFTYPLWLEPAMGTHAQAELWDAAYIGFGALSLMCAAFAWRGAPQQRGAAPSKNQRATPRQYGLWIVLAAVPSALLLATTEAITTDISTVPFFWVLPLALYLLTFIIAFAQTQWPSIGRLTLGAAVGLACYAPPALWPGLPLLTQAGLGCGGLFLLCLMLHSELVRRRPPPSQLTGFYLALSIGGALGGASAALLAPLLLNSRLELPILLVLTAGVFTLLNRRAFGLIPVAAGVVCALLWPTTDAEILNRQRSFYGTLRVEEFSVKTASGAQAIRHLVDGRVSHGLQVVAKPRESHGYYHPKSPIGRLFLRVESPRRVGLIGLGAGSLAAYGRAGDTFRFYELNPDVADIAKQYFTYLSDSAADIEVSLGDARLSMANETPNEYALLVLDAFTGDAVPAHLLTTEAFDLWASHLAPNGVLAVHVSNHHLDLARLVYQQSKARGWPARVTNRQSPSPLGTFAAQWVITAPPAAMQALGLEDDPPRTLEEQGAAPVWTDDHSPLWPILR